MKKLSFILLTLLLAFGFTSTAMANNNYGADLDPDPNRTVTFHKGITTIVTTEVKVSHDEKVVIKKYTDYYTEKKSKTTSEQKVFVEYKKQKHPTKDWYRKIKLEKTFEFTKVATWDQVTRVDKIVTFKTPIKITQTIVTTVKHYGAPNSNGKFISKDVQKYVDKEFGETTKHVETKKEVYKKNYHEEITKKLLYVKKTIGKWMKIKRG